MNSKNRTQLIIAGVAVLILAIFFSSATFLTVEPGYRGVLFKRFTGGVVKDDPPMRQGFHVVAPWNKVFLYDCRLQEREQHLDVLSSNGLGIKIDVSVRFQPKASKLAELHERVGKDYVKTIIVPEVRSAVREVIGKYTPQQLYAKERQAIQTQIFESTHKPLEKNHVLLDAILIRSIQLPDKIKQAIERKLSQEQKAQEYEFKIQKESKEAKRKRIEAKGIRDYQRIVSEGLTRNFLKWKGIEATKKLSESENAKVVVIGGGKDGLPLILGNN